LKRVGTLSTEEAEALVRAFTHYFHLVNLAEERHRVRVNRVRAQAETPENPRPEGFLALAQALKARGLSLEEAEAHLNRLELLLTFTAHPTETRRRTLRHHLEALQEELEEGDRTRLYARVALLYATEEVRKARPSVEDEIKGGLTCPPPSGGPSPRWWRGWRPPWSGSTARGPASKALSASGAGSAGTGMGTPS
jgi:phosphoenolpyruvate carboxylase